MMLFGVYNIFNTTCFYLSIYGIFAMNMQSVLGLFIGLDRCYNVSFPVRYSKIPLLSYIIGFTICVIASLFVTFSKYIFLAEEIIITVCIPVTAFYETSLRIWLCFNFVIAVIVIFVYGWTHIKCRMLRNSNLHIKTAESVNRILKSLIVVIAFYVSTWFLAMASLFVSEVLNLQGDPVYYIRRWSGWLVICNSSLHVFIYFWRTPDYRCLAKLRPLYG
ncbi:hypothetical protein CAEBREN_02860 [Caenorhabditis brenneri]|uniref:G-protein coupled receptors family 1 profile domain-containing protein n=1 Tax=Caenorhabditis brenneri TaxID=135651 RepID=G0NHJ3_CAEBE|nr:hypothetical protein CAEBREN_02860 [Caenorhabditis brenneri]